MPTESKELDADRLRWRCDPERLDIESTEDLEDLDGIVVGQQRAMEAIRFAVDMGHPGYNLYALGPHGVHKRDMVEHHLQEKAATQPPPSDWCYVHNFDDSHEPRVLRFPAGRGGEFKRDVEHLVDDMPDALRTAFEGEEYRTRRQMIEEKLKEQQESAVKEVEQEAEERGVTLRRTPMGFTFVPLKEDGEPMQPKEFQELPKEKREHLEGEVEELQKMLQKVMHEVPTWVKGVRDELRELDEETAKYAIGHLLDRLEEAYGDVEGVPEHLQALQADVVQNVDNIADGDDDEEKKKKKVLKAFTGGQEDPITRRYEVNLLVDHGKTERAPIVFEDNPTYDRLLGRVEHRAEMGALTTDFTLIRPGSIHRANGGYLVIDAAKLLTRPLSYDALKRALRSRSVRIESVSRALGLTSTVTLDPEPVPLDVKVVLLGERMLYHLLSRLDPDFEDLFKVAADFDEHVDRDDESTSSYARMVATLARKDELKDFERGAVARVLEEAARDAGDATKLSTHVEGAADLLREADYWARRNERERVTASDVDAAIESQERRLGRIRERMLEQIERGTVLIATEGEAVGQINGLAVLGVGGGYMFGRPNRITARARLGRGEVVDIEREVDLGGALHSKGVMILGGYLGQRYSPDRPLSLSASLVFEQSYGGVDGDSASSAELYCLLSAVAGVPLRQSLAVTGSVNQHGRVQAIGGVNEKIEGFFDVCDERGLTGEQGVLIPASNVEHLMLRSRVVDAVADGKFHIYPVQTIDEGIELLTGMTAGQRDEQGRFPEDSFNARVEMALRELAEKRRDFGKPEPLAAGAEPTGGEG